MADEGSGDAAPPLLARIQLPDDLADDGLHIKTLDPLVQAGRGLMLGPLAVGGSLSRYRQAVALSRPGELYGSKLDAAMDRQHPRDLFDTLKLYENGGLTEGIVGCIVCYLAGHNRPVHEVLFANKTDITAAFANEFEGMTKEPVSLDDLLRIRAELFADLPASLSGDHRQFLTGLVEGKPDWSLMECEHLAAMPAIRWKLTNLERLRRNNLEKFALQADELTKCLE